MFFFLLQSAPQLSKKDFELESKVIKFFITVENSFVFFLHLIAHMCNHSFFLYPSNFVGQRREGARGEKTYYVVSFCFLSNTQFYFFSYILKSVDVKKETFLFSFALDTHFCFLLLDFSFYIIT